MKMISGLKLFPGAYRFPLPVLAGILLIAAIAFSAFWPILVTGAQQSNSAKAIVRHGFTVDGRIEGSVQQLSGEDTTINDGAAITGDLLTPGTPTLHQNDNPNFGGLAQGNGSEQPASYEITLNGHSQLGQLIKRTDAIGVAAVSAPPAASGTRDVTLSDVEHSAGDFATVRDLTLNGGGMLSVPPGTYRTLIANSGGGFVLGNAGSTQPSAYNFDSLKLNDGSQLQVVGPVILTTASGVTLNGPVGAENNPLWLTMKVASGDVTLNGGSALYGVVTAPSGTITINRNGRLIGNIVCDRLTVNTGGLLRIVQ
jgi:cytoskeletal protein CcmA (bactofilin family)